MKKLLALSIGITLLGTSIIPFSEASREAYHNYLYKTGEHKNRFAEGTPRRINYSQKNATSKYISEVSPQNYHRNYRGSRQAFIQTNVIRRNVAEKKTPFRPSTLRWGPKSGKPLTRGSLHIRSVENKNIPFYTYENDEFSLQIPQGWDNSSENKHQFTDVNREYTINIKKFSGETCAVSGHLTGCAIQLSKSENNLAIPGDGKLVITSSVTRQTYHSDTILDTPGVYTPVHTESFTANKMSKPVYISRHYVRDTDGEIFLIQTETTPRLSGKYIAISNTIFDSFRIYAQ
jgi:hypothetical protein